MAWIYIEPSLTFSNLSTRPYPSVQCHPIGLCPITCIYRSSCPSIRIYFVWLILSYQNPTWSSPFFPNAQSFAYRHLTVDIQFCGNADQNRHPLPVKTGSELLVQHTGPPGWARQCRCVLFWKASEWWELFSRPGRMDQNGIPVSPSVQPSHEPSDWTYRAEALGWLERKKKLQDGRT